MKKLLVTLLAIALMLTLAVPAFAAVPAAPTQAPVLVNGEDVAFQAYHIDGNNFFRLRDIAYALNGTGAQFNVGWDSARNAIALTSGAAYEVIGGELVNTSDGDTTAEPTSAAIFLNDAAVEFRAYHIDGSNYFMLRDLGDALGFSVSWNPVAGVIMVNTPFIPIDDDPFPDPTPPTPPTTPTPPTPPTPPAPPTPPTPPTGTITPLPGRDARLSNVPQWFWLRTNGTAFVFNADGTGERNKYDGPEPFTWSTDGYTLQLVVGGRAERWTYLVESGGGLGFRLNIENDSGEYQFQSTLQPW